MRLENQTINTVPFAICKVQLKMVNNKSIFAWFAKNKPIHYLFINKFTYYLCLLKINQPNVYNLLKAFFFQVKN